LFELTARAAEITRGTSTRLLVNDSRRTSRPARAPTACIWTTPRLKPKTVRQTFGDDFLIGASTHSLAEARAARDGGADFIVFGPIFPTPSKDKYGSLPGVHGLAGVAAELAPFPVLALRWDFDRQCAAVSGAGASGIARN